ncbi:MAG: YhgE/Pip domain-containing protein [Leucobacter sp.]
MTAALTPLRGRRVRWTTVLGLLLVPLTIAGVFLWGLWNPTERLENVTAAVVNLDEPAEVDGQLVPLGRVLAAELIAGGDSESGSETRQNFTWVLTDEADAAAGLEDGRFTASITIPEEFSAAATSLADGPEGARQATINITESDRGRLLDTALSGIVTQTATSVINQQLGEQFVGNIFVGMSTLHDGVSNAADGATELADGSGQLADGTRSLADGTQELADGTQELAAGAAGLASGQQELATGLGSYVDGASQLSSSYSALNAGATSALQQLKTLSGTLGSLESSLAGPTTNLQNGLATAGAGAATLGGSIEGLVTECHESGATATYCEHLASTLETQATEIGAGVATAGEGATGLQDVFAGLGAGGSPSGDPSAQLDQLIGGLTTFGAGLDEFAAQGSQLASGAQQSADGAAQLSSGVSALAAQTPELASGADTLADGAQAAAEGTVSLADGLGEAASGIPNYTEGERETMASTAIEAVTSEGGSDELFNSSGVPLFVGIALWAGALASFLVLSPLWARTRDAARGVFNLTLRSAMPAILLGAAQGAIAGIVLPIALGYDFSTAAAFFGLSLLAGIAFGLLVQGLSARLGGFGRFLAFALLVVAFAVGIVSTVPGPLAAVGDASPIGAAFTGFQAVASGATGGGVAAIVLVLWGLGGLALTAWAVVKERRTV